MGAKRGTSAGGAADVWVCRPLRGSNPKQHPNPGLSPGATGLPPLRGSISGVKIICRAMSPNITTITELYWNNQTDGGSARNGGPVQSDRVGKRLVLFRRTAGNRR